MKLSIQIFIAFSVVLILSILDTYSNYLLSLRVQENTEFLSKSQDIMRNSGKLHKSIIEMQSSLRGFLLTKDTVLLDGYFKGINDVPVWLVQQRRRVEDNEIQVAILDSIAKLCKEWTDSSDSLITAHNNMDSSISFQKTFNRLFNKTIRLRAGKKVGDEIARLFWEFDKSEYGIRLARGSNLASSIERTHTFSFVFFILTVIAGLLSTFYIMRLISSRIKTMVKLAENITSGNFTKIQDTHRDELTRLSASLNTMSDSLRKNITELEKRNKELDQFAYVVSHDLKAPIRGIHNVIQWIEEDLEGEISQEMRKYLSIIPERTKRMEDLINGLLDYARVSKQTPIEKTDVTELVSEIAHTIVPRNFRIEIAKLPVLYAERIKLEQVFANLLSNSVKYAKNGDGHIAVSARELSDYYEFSVKDNGIGIDPEYHQKIFEIFQTLREKNEKESTGIGLAIVKKIIDDVHGTIKVNSTVGEGTEFIFTWPKNSEI